MKYAVANWKMHHSISSAEHFLAVSREALRLANGVEVIICPPFPLLESVKNGVIGTSIKVGAQNISNEEEGAFTGEVAAAQLTGLVDYVIVGHSERKKYFGETMPLIWSKVQMALKHDLKPILCFEKVEELSVVENPQGLILAYEPTFAIGSGHPDTPENAAATIRDAKAALGYNMPILYGGSVTAKNVPSFLAQRDIAGTLVGGASLDPASFVDLVHASQV